MLLGPPKVSIPNGTSIRSCFFAGRKRVTDRHHATGTSVAIVRICCIRCGLKLWRRWAMAGIQSYIWDVFAILPKWLECRDCSCDCRVTSASVVLDKWWAVVIVIVVIVVVGNSKLAGPHATDIVPRAEATPTRHAAMKRSHSSTQNAFKY